MARQQIIVNDEFLIPIGNAVLVASASSPGLWHELRWVEAWACDCKGYQFRGHCRHHDAVDAWFKTPVSAPVDEPEIVLVPAVAGPVDPETATVAQPSAPEALHPPRPDADLTFEQFFGYTA